MNVVQGGYVNIQSAQSQKVSETPNSADRAQTQAAPAFGSPDDAIDLSSQNDLVALAQAAGASQRNGQVEQLRALVQSGKYEVDSASLSESIVQGALKGY